MWQLIHMCTAPVVRFEAVVVAGVLVVVVVVVDGFSRCDEDGPRRARDSRDAYRFLNTCVL